MHDCGFEYLVTQIVSNPELWQVNKESVKTSCWMNMAKQGREYVYLHAQIFLVS